MTEHVHDVLSESWQGTLRQLQGLERGEVLGEGGMGTVYSAHQDSLEREVAVKVPIDERAASALVHEARISGRLGHPNIAPVHELGADEDGRPILVMKRIEGTPWSEWIRRPTDAMREEMDRAGGPLAFHLGVMIKVADAVAFAHSRQVVHRDIKPSNIMIGQFGVVYLLDWGLALTLEECADPFLYPGGTPAYMAPEMARGGPITQLADVYMLGVTLHEAGSGLSFRTGDDPLALMASAFAGRQPDAPPGMLQALRAVVTRATAREPEHRYPDALAFRDAVQQVAQQQAWIELVARVSVDAQALLHTLESDTSQAQYDRETGHMLAKLAQLHEQKADPILEGWRVRLLEAQLDRASASDDLKKANRLLDELGPAVGDSHRFRVDVLKRRHEKRTEEVRRLREREDKAFGTKRRIRAVTVLIVGQLVLWPGCFVAEVVRGVPLTMTHLLPVAILQLIVVIGGLANVPFDGRDTLGRRAHVGALMTLSASAVLYVVGWWMVLSPQQTLGLVAICTGSMLALQALHTLPGLWPTAFIRVALGGLLLVIGPTPWFWFLVMLGNVLGYGNAMRAELAQQAPQAA